ncbi:MAG: outer membrane beta-barrel protein [Bacteroidota bacterium]
MKKSLLLSVMCFTVTVASHAQKGKGLNETPTNVTAVSAKELEGSPSSKNNWQFQLRQNVGYSNLSSYFDGLKTSRERNLSINAGANYFVVDGIAVGLELDIDLLKDVNVISKDESSITNWMTYLNVRAQKQLSAGFNIYGQASVGIGKATYKQTNGSITSSSSDDLLGIKVEAGAPMPLYGNSNSFITPFIAYKYSRTKDEDFTATDNGIQIGLVLESYMGCRDMSCDMKNGFRNSKNMYQQGNSFIDFTSAGSAEFGSSTSKYSYMGGSSESKSSYTSTSLSGAYRYYVADNISIGAALNFSSASTKNKTSDNKYSYTSYLVGPVAGINLPVSNGWNNLSLEAYYNFGSARSTSTNGSNSSTDKQNISSYGFNFCYNDFFGKRIAITPKLGYQWGNVTYKEDGEDDYKENWNGLYFGLGIRKFFPN